ncbi:MAG: reverse transcriptase domain-containing protein [Burkholderiaceae bacterium]
MPALEDKIVQRASAEVLGAIYEQDFIGFSYGFRPGRSAHDALDAVAVGVTARKVNWILDADIAKFFDTIEHAWLIKFVEHRVADARVIRLLKKWLHAGVLEDGQVTRSALGTVQGGSISPLLANIYLHYAFDLWAQQWRRRHAKGDMVIVRYADDWVAGFEHRMDAEAFKRDVAQRLATFGLALHENKTRLIEFGRFARANRSRRGQGKPETFDFLGFTHCCGKSSKGKFMVLRLTSAKRLRAKLHAVKDELRRRMHRPIAEQGQYLRTVVSGHSRYFAVPCNGAGAGLPLPGRPAVASHVVPSQPGQAPELEAHAPHRRTLAATSPHLPPLPGPTSDRHDPRQEPCAVAPHARICEGGDG